MGQRRQSKRHRRRGGIRARAARRAAGGPAAVATRPKKFIPNGDVNFREMAGAFVAAIANDPECYKVSSDDVAMLQRRVREFSEALNKAMGEQTRTAYTIMEKKSARTALVKLIQSHANLIRADQSISAAEKINLKIHERPTKLHRRQCPKTPPVLRYVYGNDAKGDAPGAHVLEFRELHGSEQLGKGRPPGAARLELFVDLVPPGEDVPKHPAERCGWPRYMRSYGKSPITVEFPVSLSGPMLVVYWARWADGTGDVGPFSETCQARVEGWTSKPALHEADEARRIEMKYVIVQAPYALPERLENIEAIDAKQMLPAATRNEA